MLLRGKSASERVSERKGFQRLQRFLEVFRGFRDFSEVVRGPLRYPLRGQISLSEALSPVAPNRAVP